jgi:hypothetical protein
MMIPEGKKYRPWRNASEVPAPLMVRHKSLPAGVWYYASPKSADKVLITHCCTISFEDLFREYEQHDGSPAGQEE